MTSYTNLHGRPLPDIPIINYTCYIDDLVPISIPQPFSIFSEFCGEENHGIELSPDAVPSDSVADYLLEPAEPEPSEDGEKESIGPDNEKEGKKASSGGGKGPSKKSNLVIFAVDVSGSMSTTVEVPALQAEWSSVTGRGGGGGGGARYISRLEAIKEAVCRHLDHMSVTEPHNKVRIKISQKNLPLADY